MKWNSSQVKNGKALYTACWTTCALLEMNTLMILYSEKDKPLVRFYFYHLFWVLLNSTKNSSVGKKVITSICNIWQYWQNEDSCLKYSLSLEFWRKETYLKMFLSFTQNVLGALYVAPSSKGGGVLVLRWWGMALCQLSLERWLCAIWEGWICATWHVFGWGVGWGRLCATWEIKGVLLKSRWTMQLEKKGDWVREREKERKSGW